MSRTSLHRALAVSLVALSASACGDKLLGIAGTISVSPLELDYSQNSAIGTVQSIPVSITNQGSAVLNISNIKVSSDPNNELSVAGLLTTDCMGGDRSGSAALSPGECAQFSANWNPNGVHMAAGSIEIDSDDAQTPVVTLPVTGNVVAIGCQFSNPSCSGSTTCCDNNCVDTQSDPANCGGCGNTCSSDQTCNSGVCTNVGCADSNPACTGTQACCDNACVETQSDPTHCGGCNPCAAGQTCNGGVCTGVGCAESNPACSGGEMCCSDTCVNTQTDPSHCGGCSACAAGDACTAGVCVAPSGTCNPLTAPCSGTDLCCNHVCITDTPSGMCPCTGGATSNFGVGSIIIPMDVCWQRGEDMLSTTPSYCTDNSKTTSDDAPLKAYGLVFFLIRHNITVYVGIDPNKTAIDAVDMSLTSTGSTPPVQRYNWSTGAAVALSDATQTTVQYRGGPFLIDASQHDAVLNLLNTNSDFAQFKTEANITVHIATVAFQSAIAKTITAVPSRIALLAPKNDTSSYQILVRYLTSAGLNFAGAGGTPAAPGQIYDQLQEADFLPNLAGSSLGKGGYKLLWSPHWEGGTSNTAAQLATIGQFVNAGGDLFGECAAIGTLEGFQDLSLGDTSVTGGSASTRFMTTNGLAGNSITNTNNNGSYTGPFVYGGFSSVFAQRGDFPFYGFYGAITDYFPASSPSSSYYSGVVNYVSANISNNSTQLFNSYDQHAAGKGTVVYLAGHDYSYGGTGDVIGTTAGSRLVLNTIFSLGTNDVCQP